MLVVLLDLGAPQAGGETPVTQRSILLTELGAYRPELLARPRVVVGSKSDLAADEDGVCDLVLSAATGSGVPALVERLGVVVQAARAEAAVADAGEVVVHRPAPEGVDVRRAGAGAWLVIGRARPSGPWPCPIWRTPGRRPRRCGVCGASGSTGRWPGPGPATATRSRWVP